MNQPMMGSRKHRPFFACAGVALMVLGGAASTVRAQNAVATSLARGGSATLVQVVQQTINILPPALSQAYYYDYDENLGVVVGSERVGSSLFREPRTLPRGRWAVRGSLSYFDLSGSVSTEYKQQDFERYATYGAELSARGAILSLAATYGLTDSIELELGIPITLIDAEQRQLLPTNTRAFEPPVSCSWPSRPCPGATVPTLADAKTLARDGSVTVSDGTIILDRVNANDIEPGVFNDGTSVGLGRISLGTKVSAFRSSSVELSLLPQIFFPSPSSDEFAGPDSTALALGGLGSYAFTSWMQGILNVGYEWDTESSALSRFAWALGTSFPTDMLTVDVGMSGSVYQNGVAWSPRVFPDDEPSRSLAAVDADSVRLDSTFAEFLFGLKVPLGKTLAISGSAVVPVDGSDFRPAAVGSIALEGYF